MNSSKKKVILHGLILLAYFIIQFIFVTIYSSITLFGTIHESFCTISAKFYLYLRYFPQKVFSFNKISRFWTDPYVAFGIGESTLLPTSRFLTIWMPKNVIILLFSFIGNFLRFLGMCDDNVWFIFRNLKWINYFSHSILRFECELSSLLKKKKNLHRNK